ncbi:MAG: hypothetical protein ACD_2C00172G0004 [uncultured bacterium (gcode 4)]|uniref:Uncharacterized protein n=1 Tax=uncultured bacterium (gcode 4) TaxID=1234023 RepID=K2FE74_9BACT|nr:MAG: hypothetical protein ACD_2C00172G0004 [uncultured bacterium (gcode 4)]
MKKLDFSRFRQKYSTLTDLDVNFLNDYFNRQDVFDKMQVFEDARKKFARTIFALWFLEDAYLLYNFNAHYPLDTLQSIVIANILTLFFWIFILFNPKLSWIKKNIIPGLMAEISPNLKYDIEGEHDFDKGIFFSKWLLNKYDAWDMVSDSMHFAHIPSWSVDWKTSEEIALMAKEDIWWFEIYSVEFKSFINNRNSKWWKTQSCNNHATLTKIILNNPVVDIESDIVLKSNIKNDKKMLLAGSIILWLWLTPVMGFLIFLLSASDDFKPYFGFLFEEPYHYYANAIIFFFLSSIIFILWNLISRKSKIKTENIEFDKEFIIECEDQIEARKILTPSFMYKVYDFVNSIDKWRRYEFIFKKGEIYIKRDLKLQLSSILSFWWIVPLFWWYMEVSYFKNLLKNIEQLLHLYIELKWTSNLVNELGILHLDKTSLNATVIGR